MKVNRRFQIIFGVQVLWLSLTLLLIAWWGTLLYQQAARIEELELMAGMADVQARINWLKTQRMLFWESVTFLLLLLSISGILFWMYWRDSRRSRSLQAFFASVTHELRTPLTSIRLQAESIADNLPQGGPESTLVGRLLEDTMRLESQVERTLELARVEGGGTVYTQALRLKPWVERTLGEWESTHRDRLKIQFRLEDCTVLADPSAVQVILKNLLENSMRHAKKNRVEVVLSTERDQGQVALSYKDDGEGYAGNPEELGQIFHKGPASQGAGVGLYLVRTLMERMDGKAVFARGPGFGASLWFKEARSDG